MLHPFSNSSAGPFPASYDSSAKSDAAVLSYPAAASADGLVPLRRIIEPFLMGEHLTACNFKRYANDRRRESHSNTPAGPNEIACECATATALSKKQPDTSREIVAQWAHASEAEVELYDLKTLWARSGMAHASDWDAGAIELAELLMPYARPGQTIDQTFIQGLSPLTADQLETRLRW